MPHMRADGSWPVDMFPVWIECSIRAQSVRMKCLIRPYDAGSDIGISACLSHQSRAVRVVYALTVPSVRLVNRGYARFGERGFGYFPLAHALVVVKRDLGISERRS